MAIFRRLEPLAFAFSGLFVIWGAGMRDASVDMFLWIGAGICVPALYALFSAYAESDQESEKENLRPYIRWGILATIVCIVLIGAEWDWVFRLLLVVSVVVTFLRLFKPFVFASTPILDGLSAVVFAAPFMLAWWPYRAEVIDPGSFWGLTVALAVWCAGIWWWSGLFTKKEDEEDERYTTAVEFGYTTTNRLAWFAFVIGVGSAIYSGAWLVALGLFGFVLGCYVLSPSSKIHAIKTARIYALALLIAITVGMSLSMEWYVYAQYMWYHVATVIMVFGLFVFKRMRT